jgi:hypothetical protein
MLDAREGKTVRWPAGKFSPKLSVIVLLFMV